MIAMADIEQSAESAFAAGLALFNQGRFFACHEAWEVAWKQARGVERTVIQGLIQTAVALLHVERGNPRGARLVYAKARAKLDPIPPRTMGLELEDFRIELDRYFAAVLVGDEPPARPLLRRN